MDVFLTIYLDVFLPVSGFKNISVGFINGSNSLYDCIIGRSLYTLTNIHSDVFLPVVKMPCANLQLSMRNRATIFPLVKELLIFSPKWKWKP